MDLLSLGFLLLILIASGGIAYVADGLGKKLGKKRLSVFGLRPKHVAQIGTVAMGVIVSMLTILVIAAASRDARDWLIRGRGLLVEQKRLKGEVEDLQTQRLDEEKAKRRVRDELSQARKQLDSAQQDATKQSAALADLRAKRDGLLANVDRLRADVSRISDDLTRAKLVFAKSTRDLASAKSRLTSTETQVFRTQSALRVAKRNLEDSSGRLVLAGKNFKSINDQKNEALKERLDTYKEVLDFKDQVMRLSAQKDVLDSQVRALQVSAQVFESQRDRAQQNLDAVQSNLDKAGQELAQLEQFQTNFIESTFRSSRTEPLTYRGGEEVARVFVPAGATPDVARAALDSLLQDARAQAQARGAKGHRANGQTLAAADIVERKDAKTGAAIDADALKRAVVARIAGSPEDQALVATSSLNAFSGETVSLEIAVVPNPMVYRRNEMLAETRIDGSQSDEEILTQLRRFLGTRVRDRAVQDRMVPRAGSRDPFGEVSATSWLGLVQDVKRAGRSVRVQALAGDDTRAADPLRLEFRVK